MSLDPVLSNMSQVVAQEVARNPPQIMTSTCISLCNPSDIRKEASGVPRGQETMFPYPASSQVAQMNMAQQAQLIQGALAKKVS